MHIRIISGKYKGRRISAPKNLPIRPTTDRAKEALFNILQNRVYIPSMEILDLYSGSGSIAYEFASRGARHITAVDKNYQVVKFIKKISTEFEFPIQVIKKDVLKFLEKTTEKYDFIFADPPYDLDPEILQKTIHMIFEKDLLKNNGIFVLEHKEQLDFSHDPRFVEKRKYGISVFSFFQNNKITDNE